MRLGVGLNSDLGCSATLMGAVPDRARNVLFSPYTEAVRERLRMVYKRIEHPKRPDIDALLIKCVKTTRPDALPIHFLTFCCWFGFCHRYAGRETELIRAVEAKYGYSSEGPFPARQAADVRATQGSVEPATPPHSPARPHATCSAEVPLTTPPRVSAAVVAAAAAGISPSPPDTAHAGPEDAKEGIDSAAASSFST